MVAVQDATSAPTYGGETRLERLAVRLWSHPAWLAPTAIALCVSAAIGYVLAVDPTDSRTGVGGTCAFQALTGLNCPGCGGTRMVWYALHGDFIQAGRHHLVAFIAIPFLIYAYIAWVAKRMRGRSVKWLPQLRFSGWLLAGYAGVWVIYAVLRNIPVEPFSWFFVAPV